MQLSYQSGLLLISTLYRTIIVNKKQSTQIIQVGQKERKMLIFTEKLYRLFYFYLSHRIPIEKFQFFRLGKLGAVFAKNKNHTHEPIIYASRPGLRIWQADKNGIVVKTLILKVTWK